MKRLISIAVCVVMLFSLAVPAFPAGAVVRTITYRASDCTDPENSNAAFNEQVHDTNGKPTGEGIFSRFDGTTLGDYATYVVNVETAGEYDFFIRYRAHESTAKTCDVYLNDVKLNNEFNQTGTPNTANNDEMGKVTLNAGDNVIRIVTTSASANNNYRLNIFSFNFSYDDGQEPGDQEIPIGVIGGNTGNRGTVEGETVVYKGIDTQSAEYSSAAFASQTTSGHTFSRFDATTAGSYATYIVNAAAAGEYKLLIRYRAHETVGRAHFHLNGEIQEKNFNSTGAANSVYQVNMGIYQLEAGDNYLQFEMYEPGTSGTYKLNIVDFTLAPPSEEELNGYVETPGASTDKVVSYPFQSLYGQSEIFSLKVDGIDVPVVAFDSNWYDYAQFSFKDSEQPVTIEITYTSNITSYSISPLKLGLTGTVSGNKLTFTLSDSQYLIIRLNGAEKRLVITADPPETDVPEPDGEGVFNVTDEQFGADKTGKESSFEALQAAIDAASAYGSIEGNSEGVVYVPSGVYFTGGLILKSNMKFYISGGAIIRASRNEEDFTANGRKNSLGLPITYLITTEHGSSNIKIYGRGTVDGDGHNVRALGFALQTLSPINTSYFTTDGITYRDSGMWSIVPAWSDHLEFLNLKMLNTVRLGEDDGIDICGCQDVVVRHAIGIMWDDPYTTKSYDASSGEIAGGWGEGPGEPNENIVFDDCISWTGCYGFKAGQGFWYDHENIKFTNGTVYDCAAGIGIHHKQGGSSCNNITFENIDIENISFQNDDHRTWFVAYIQGNTGTGGPVSNVTVKNINVRATGTSVPKLVGKAEDILLSNVSFENITFKGSTGAATTLAQMGFADESDPAHFIYNENCYVVNPFNAKTPAEYYSSATSSSIVNDEAADTAKAVNAADGATLYFKDIDFGSDAEKFNINFAAQSAGYVDLCVDSEDNSVGRINISATDGAYQLGGVDISDITGTHDVYLVVSGNVKLDWFQVYTAPGEADVLAAKEVDSLIDAIGTIGDTMGSEQRKAIKTAREAYDGLSDIAKSLVEKYDDLLYAEQKSAELPEEPDYILGDLSGDGKIDVSDVVALRQIIMAGQPTEDKIMRGDLDGNGTLNVSDVVALRRMIMEA